jgi:N-acetyl-gamma-glutamyl-phosphate reductase
MARFSLILLAAPAALAFTPSNGSIRRSIDLSAKKKVFIDGEAGTTGIQVRDRLAKRDDLEILSIPEDLRKDEATRKKFINDADAVILCLPDDASEMAASWVAPDNDRTVLIDASTAFRVDDSWTYGFPGKIVATPKGPLSVAPKARLDHSGLTHPMSLSHELYKNSRHHNAKH